MAWSIKEVDMKYVKYLILILLPVLVFAQTEENAPSMSSRADGMREDIRGIVIAIDENGVNFNEEVMQLSPDGTTIVSEDDAITDFASLHAPFYAEVDIYWIGDVTYLKSIHVLKQFEYDSEGAIIGTYEEEHEHQ